VFQPEKVKSLLKKEDPDGKLVAHLTAKEVWDVLPLKQWFSCCFSSVLPEIPFERQVTEQSSYRFMIK